MKGYVICVYKSISNEEKLKEYAVKARAAVEKYKGKFLVKGGRINLKTDNRLLFNSTLEQIEKHGFTLHVHSFDIYGEWGKIPEEWKAPLSIKTYYETLFMEKGYRINFLSFSM